MLLANDGGAAGLDSAPPWAASRAGAEFKLNKVDDLVKLALHCRRCCRVSFTTEGEALFITIFNHDARSGTWRKATQMSAENVTYLRAGLDHARNLWRPTQPPHQAAKPVARDFKFLCTE